MLAMSFSLQSGIEDHLQVKYSSIFVGLVTVQFVLHLFSDLGAKDDSLSEMQYVKNPEKQRLVQITHQHDRDAEIDREKGFTHNVRETVTSISTLVLKHRVFCGKALRLN